MSISALFSPLTIRGVEFRNRTVVSPMCTYSATDGLANDWHLVHLGKFAQGGAAAVFTEASAVEPRGRITHGDLGIWSADHAQALKPVTDFIRRSGAMPAIQIAHAGRKASMQRPWHGNGPLDDTDRARGEDVWDIVAASAEPVKQGWLMPTELSVPEIASIQAKFAAAAGHAVDAGFEVLEIHSAHGYLAHSFLSPLSNHRNDAYGGDLAGRMRFTLETAEQVRAVWPEDKPLFVRISAVDVDGADEGWSLEDSVALSGELKARGVDVIDCSSGGIDRLAAAGLGPREQGFRAPYGSRIRDATGIFTMVVGLVLDADVAEDLVASGAADLVAVGREALYNPNWPHHIAHELGVDPEFADWPEPYGWWLVRREPLLDGVRGD
ncbi:MAG: NADH:flavin oxidoreductase / NADH oxidase [Rhodospirillaceae bacterium]|nr:NADH:flavin oxidoreductase / NADH oxidase [Rhodospirillaceae bacterium]